MFGIKPLPSPSFLGEGSSREYLVYGHYALFASHREPFRLYRVFTAVRVIRALFIKLKRVSRYCACPLVSCRPMPFSSPSSAFREDKLLKVSTIAAIPPTIPLGNEVLVTFLTGVHTDDYLVEVRFPTVLLTQAKLKPSAAGLKCGFDWTYSATVLLVLLMPGRGM